MRYSLSEFPIFRRGAINKTHVSKNLTYAAIGIIIALGIFFSARKIYCETQLKVEPFNAALTTPAKELSKAFSMIAQHVRPAVVSVFSEKVVKFKSNDFFFPFGDDLFSQFFGDPEGNPEKPGGKHREYSLPVKGMGSGMVLDNKGHILTNFHVVGNVDRIKVQLANRQTYRAKVTQVDPKTDIAVIQLEGNFPKDLPIMTFGDSDLLNAGDLVIAVGAPFGLSQTVTQGIISATGRSNVGIEAYEDFIQTDAPINPGNSGGPLVNMNGEIVGINTAIATSGPGQFSGVGFAVPSKLILTMLPKLLRGEKIKRGRLGVVIQDLNDDLARQFETQENSGVLVAEVEKNSAADRAGLKAGDIIVKFGTQPITETAQLRNIVSQTPPGTEINLRIIRNKNEMNLIVKVAPEETEEIPAATLSRVEGSFLDRIGISVQNIDKSFSETFGVKSGVVVTQIHEGSPAAFAGVMPFDVIIEANRKKINSVKDLKEVLQKSRDQESVLFLLKRQNVGLYIAIHTR